MPSSTEILNRVFDDQADAIRVGDWGQQVTKTMTFDGATTNDPGDFDGTGNPATLFNVTGLVKMRIVAVCTVSLAGASATLSVGTATTAAGLIAQTTATDIDANELWHDASPDASVELTTVAPERFVFQDVIQTVGTANITAGSITYYCWWKPESADGNVEAA